LNKGRAPGIIVRMKQMFALTFLLTTGIGLHAEILPVWLIPLREAVFEQLLTADQTRPLYLAATAAARQHTTGANRYLALSRAEFFMGQVLLFEERNPEARAHFAEGLRLAEIAVEMAPSAEAWVIRAENLGHLIQADGRRTFAIRHGLDVGRFAENALALDGRNAAAQRLLAARYVFAPGVLGNINRGVDMMMAIYNGGGDMSRDDLFNVTSAIGWGRVQQRNYSEAIPWLRKALEVYPTNQFATELLEIAETSDGGRRRSR